MDFYCCIFLWLLILMTTYRILPAENKTKCKSLQYVEIGEPGPVQCFFRHYQAITWYILSMNDDAILMHSSMETVGWGYASGEFDISPNGSLIINNVTKQHEGKYIVEVIGTTADSFETHTVTLKTTVKPTDPAPVLEMFAHECDPCFLTNSDIYIVSSLSCIVRNVRPKIDLGWYLQTSSGDKYIPSFETIFQNNNLTFTTNISTRYPLETTSSLFLLACRAINLPWLFDEVESTVLVDKSGSHIPTRKTINQLVQLHSRMTLICTETHFDILTWKRSLGDSNELDTLGYIVKLNVNKSNTFENAFQLMSTGLLSLEQTTAHDEGFYICNFNDAKQDSVKEYQVSVYAHPVPDYLVIIGCSPDYYCVLDVQYEGNLTCEASGIRPEVKLEWRVYRDGSPVSFRQQQLKVLGREDTFDISLTSTFVIPPNTGNRFTVECRVTGPYAELFKLSTKLDLLVQGAYPTNEPIGVTNRRLGLLWILAVAIPLLMLLCFFGYKAKRRSGVKQKRSQSVEENISMISQDEGKDGIFINQLKMKYEVLYDAVQPIPYIRDRLYCVDTVFVEGGIEVFSHGGNNIIGQWEPLSSYQHILDQSNGKSKVFLIEGEPGYGKSTISLQFAYDWCNNVKSSKITNSKVLVFLRLRQLGGVPSIVKAIKQFILPIDTLLSEEDVREILQKQLTVFIVLDGYDEYPDQDNLESDIAHVLKREMFQNAIVVLTTRSSCLPKEFAPNTCSVRLTGFGEAARDQYIRKAVVGDDDVEVERIKRLLHENPVIGDLCQVPLFFVMFAHMTHEREDFKTFKSVTSFFRYMISCFHSHMRNKLKDKNVRKFELHETQHSELDKLAFKGLSGKHQKIVWEKEYLRGCLGQEFYDQYVRTGILVEEETLDIADGDAQYKTEVRFYHKLFCEWYAAHHLDSCLAELIGDNIKDILRNLDPFDLQYVYRFACGISSSSAEKIIKYLKNTDGSTFAIPCTVEQKSDSYNSLQTIKELVSTKMITIKEGDSLLLQRSTIHMLEIASRHKLYIYGLYLHNIFDVVDVTTGCIVLQSGLSIPVLSSLRYLEINEEGKEITTKEVDDVVQFALKCEKIEIIQFSRCLMPQYFPIDGPTLRSLQARRIRVYWGPKDTMDLDTGRWKKNNGVKFTDEDYQANKNNGVKFTDEDYQANVIWIRETFRNTKYQCDRRLAKGEGHETR